MQSIITPEQIIKHYNMIPLEGEGGVFYQSYISDEMLPASVIPGRNGDHAIVSAILYLLNGNSYSRMHRLPSDEIFHFYMGDPVDMLLLYPDGTGKMVRMGHDILNGEQVQVVVPKGVWQGTRLTPQSKWALLGTVMAPGYQNADYEDGTLDELCAKYPKFCGQIKAYAGTPVYK